MHLGSQRIYESGTQRQAGAVGRLCGDLDLSSFYQVRGIRPIFGLEIRAYDANQLARFVPAQALALNRIQSPFNAALFHRRRVAWRGAGRLLVGSSQWHQSGPILCGPGLVEKTAGLRTRWPNEDRARLRTHHFWRAEWSHHRFAGCYLAGK